MLTVPLLAFGFLGACFALLAPVLARLFRKCTAEEITADWLANFDPASYRPMHGLLSSEDFQFLVRQPGFDLSLYRKLRRERMLIYRQYLRRLISDFNRLHTYLRLVIAQSQEDRSALVMKLATLKLRFTFSVVQAEMSYYLCLVGVGTLATRSVVSQLEEMTNHLHLVNDLA